ncbi:MAG: glycosyl transferase family 28 [Terrimonas sp.]|nr:glycosyl transferase family 28 [Terrimonas sp.]
MAEKININQPPAKSILVAPLDWGLGHTTRCIPIIKELCQKGCRVIVAGTQTQVVLLKSEFPGLQFIDLPGYNIKYGSNGSKTILALIRQIPAIKRAIRQENDWLKKIVIEEKLDAVISDNRFGLHHPAIPSVFLTHQLSIQTPFGQAIAPFIRAMNYRHIEKFSACWIPDFPGQHNLAGKLSHPKKMPGCPTHYVGPLSRFTSSLNQEEKNRLLILLSGPEPQRSIFEKIIIESLSHHRGSATVVRGVPGSPTLIPSTGNLTFYNHLPTPELKTEIEKAAWIISRSGYSTIMDLSILQKKSILVPTPGQSEQVYLAKYLFAKKFAFTTAQNGFSIEKSLEEAGKFPYRFDETSVNHLLSDALDGLLETIKHPQSNLAFG